MATETEKKFLVINDNWKPASFMQQHYTQGYFSTSPECSVRVRMSGDQANLNVKSATLGITRSEYDYPIPAHDAREMLDHLCIKPLLEKTRYFVKVDQHTWEIDVFHGDNEGLIVAEIELKSAEESFTRPEWIGEEVSDDPRYYNVCLIKHPYKSWKR